MQCCRTGAAVLLLTTAQPGYQAPRLSQPSVTQLEAQALLEELRA
jgi:hypothetical protein